MDDNRPDVLASTRPRISEYGAGEEFTMQRSLPQGRRLKIEILSNWGDPFYVGLNGIELFDERGQIIDVSVGAINVRTSDDKYA